MNHDQTIQQLLAGAVIAYPTETFFGLAADPTNSGAVSQLLRLKTRDEGKGIPLIIDDWKSVERWIEKEIPEVVRKRKSLQEKFWPGPLTVVFTTNAAAREYFDRRLFGAAFSLAVRVSSATQARSLAQALGGAITATSANPAGEAPPQTVGEVKHYFRNLPVLSAVYANEIVSSLPSTIVDTRSIPFLILREGAIPAADLVPWCKEE